MGTRYEEGYGVVPMEWRTGHPASYGLVLVEIWSAETRVGSFEARKPAVRGEAKVEVWVRVGDGWRRVGHNGELRDVTPGEVRRWMPIVGSRVWWSTITLDGWSA